MNTRSRDVRELLGMHTVGARILLGIYTASLIVVTIGIQEDLAAAWPTVGSLLILVAASVALLIVPGDPIPWPATIAMIAAGPLASALTLAVLPVPVALPLQLWTHGGATTIYCFMCLRGRLGSAWVGLAATAAVYTVWSTLTGQGPLYGFVVVIIDAGPLGMATILTFTLRPNTKATFALRDAAARRIGEESAAIAAEDERTQQLNTLDQLARPLLQRIATAVPLEPDEKTACELLEAHLRDRLRAPLLADPATADLTRTARLRGTQVDLIDDHGLDDAGAETRAAVIGAVREALGRPSDSVRVRIHPPGRATLASVLVNRGDSVDRAYFRRAGTVNESETQAIGSSPAADFANPDEQVDHGNGFRSQD